MSLEISLPVYKLQQAINLASCLDDEIRLKIFKESLEIKLVDPANVAMCIVYMGASEFTKLNVPFLSNQDRESFWSFEIDAINMLNILKKFDPRDFCTLRQTEYISGQENVLEIGGRLFNLTRTDLVIRAEPRIPKLELPVFATLNLQELHRDISFLSERMDYVHISYLERHDHAEIWVTDEKTKEKFRFRHLCKIEVKNQGKYYSSIFSIDYFGDILKSMRVNKKWICKEITLNFGTDWPIIISGAISENFTFAFYQAPRIESD